MMLTRSILFMFLPRWNECLLRAKRCSRANEVCVCKKGKVCVCVCVCVCVLTRVFLGGAECILYESVLLRPFHTEQWVQLCCVSLCWQMIQWLYCESIVKLLSRLLSQWIQRNRLTKLLHFVLDTFCNQRLVSYLSDTRCTSLEESSKTGIMVLWRYRAGCYR